MGVANFGSVKPRSITHRSFDGLLDTICNLQSAIALGIVGSPRLRDNAEAVCNRATLGELPGVA